MKQVSKKEIEEHAHIDKEIYNRVPFFTPFQDEVQKIIKELWSEDENFFLTHGKLWLDMHRTKLENELPTIFLYSKIWHNLDGELVYECDDEEYANSGFHVEIINLEKYSMTQESVKVNIFGTDNNDLKGISLLSIMDILKYHFITISNLHEKIIEISKSNLETNTKKYAILYIVKEIDNYIERNSYELNFKYPLEIICDLNDLHLYYDWIDSGDSFVIQLALEAYQEITYYYEWLEKHKVEEKRFREKISNIMSLREECRLLTNAKPPFYEKLPQHPQDILHGLASSYWDFYGRKKIMGDDGIQSIIRIISNYKRMPKKSILLKELQAYQNETNRILVEMIESGAKKSEVMTFIVDRAFGKEKIK